MTFIIITMMMDDVGSLPVVIFEAKQRKRKKGPELSLITHNA